ncbi:pyruvate kinase isoform X3 [Eurytemora carolleeae]|uniref:pyruvate kinase isoform X3 n=1 Tax=Eurytemora carolleeae TaxID=1294199 RepID=UPI000C76C574|nr:pyruvate kinase isoform X3 [Eurytemora carolleeae]|eukprot:XP_023338197.1 pyruvate kinase-like isoform X3 [Eurytemora affinis]
MSGMINDDESILEPMDIPAAQRMAAKASTTLDYVSNLDIYSKANRMRLSGIVCTIGPVSRSPEVLLELIENGMNVARMNFSHGSHEYHGGTIANCRTAAAMYKEKHGVDPSLAIALDTKGPEIRTGLLEGDDGRKEVELKAGATIKITTNDEFKEKCSADILWLDYKNITKVLTPGKRIYIDDGLISVQCKEIGDDHVIGLVENGGNLGSRKGCNLPGTDTDLPAVSEKDKSDLLFGVEQGVDMVFASFIRDAAGVAEVKAVLGEKGKNIWIIPKIENQQGVKNLDEIIACSNGLMVARGDMGIEIPTEKVFIAQKAMIAKCNRAGVPVICATQMLESMVKKPRPTRAEASDVANAILDGSDCVMLSGETAKGDFPSICVQTMAKIAREAEACLWNERFFEDLMRAEYQESTVEGYDSTHAIAISSVLASYKCRASAIVVLTTSGKTGHVISKYKPLCPILAVTRHDQVARQMQLFRGLTPLLYTQDRDQDWMKDIDARAQFAIDFGKKNRFIAPGDNIVMITGWKQGSGSSNTMRIITVKYQGM